MRFALRNLAGNYAVYAASIVSGIVLTPVIIHSIGKDGYGVWVFIGSVTVFLRTLDVGLAPAIVRYTAFYRGRADTAAISELASCALVLYALVSAVLALAGVVLALVLPSLVSIHGTLSSPARVAAFVTVLALALELPLGSFSSILKGQQRFDIVNVGSLVSIVLYASLIGALLTTHGSLWLLAVIALGATMVRVLLPAALVRRELPSLRVASALVTRARVQELLSFSVYASVGQIAGKVIFSADAILIGIVLGSVPVATYGVALRLFTVAAGIASTGTDVLYPAYSELEGRGDYRSQRSYVEAALRAATCVVVLVTGPLLLLPSWVIGAWLGDGFGGSTAPLVLLAATLYFSQSSSVMAQFLLGRGRPRPLAIVQSIFGAANVVGTVVVLEIVRDVWVAALTTLSLEAIVATLILPRLVAREGIRLAALVRAWTRPVAAGAAAAAVTLVPAAVLWSGSRSLPGILGLGALWSVVYAAVAWVLALGPREREFIRRTASRGAARSAEVAEIA
jgi:O-antigen/teichoic acid export membrane protein